MYIGIDIGGTNIAADIVDENGKIIYKLLMPTMAHRQVGERGYDLSLL